MHECSGEQDVKRGRVHGHGPSKRVVHIDDEKHRSYQESSEDTVQ
jgi:hypothetical protein